MLDALNQNWLILETKRLRRDEPPSCTPEVPSPDHHLSLEELQIISGFWSNRELIKRSFNVTDGAYSFLPEYAKYCYQRID
jgi:hypothetical protein